MAVNNVHLEGEQASPSTALPKTSRDYLRYAVIGFAALWVLLVGTLAIGRFAGFSTVTVLSESMVPAASVDDLMITRPFDGSVVLNDIYVFDSPADGHQTAHRIIAKGSDSNHWITKGDANETQDMQEIPTAAVTSHVVAVIPRIVNVFPFLDSLTGRLLTLTIPFLLLLAPLLKRRTADKDTRATATILQAASNTNVSNSDSVKAALPAGPTTYQGLIVVTKTNGATTGATSVTLRATVTNAIASTDLGAAATVSN